MRFPFTRYGYRELALFGGGALLLGWLALHYLGPIPALVPLALAAFVVSFFRDPERTPPAEPDVLASPADGTVSDVTVVEDAEFLGERATRIGIFLSVFNVHVNRSPAAGMVAYLRYRPGRFLDARHPNAGTENESNSLGLETGSVKLLVRQVSGLIARRIVCPVPLGTPLAKGERYGMIKFGSRTELYVPVSAGVDVLVQVGQAVKGGATPIVRVHALRSQRVVATAAAAEPRGIP